MDRDRLIDNYMNGRMSSAEEREFFRLLDADPLLRREFEAERTISGALLRDRSALPPADPGSRVRLLALLAALPAGVGGAGRIGGKLSHAGSVALKGTVATVVAGGISVAIYTAVRSDQSPRDLPSPVRRMIGPRPEPLQPPVAVETPSLEIVQETSPSVEPPAPAAPVHAAPNETIPVVSSPAPIPEPEAPAIPEAQPETAPAAPASLRTIPSIRSTDSVNLNITIDTGKLKLNGRSGRQGDGRKSEP